MGLQTFAWLEVMDKEVPFQGILLWVLLPSLLALAAGRWRPWLLLLVLPVPLLFHAAQLSELTDAFVGPAIRREAGMMYVALSWASPCILLGAAGLGLWLRHSSSRRFQSLAGPGVPPDIRASSPETTRLS